MTEKSHVWPLLKNLLNVDFMRVENNAGTGAPDVNGCYMGVSVWIENKIIKGKRTTFQPTQPSWIFTRTNHGGRVFVLARKDDTLYLYEGWRVRQWAVAGRVLSDGGISVEPQNPILTLEKPYDYLALRTAIFGS